MTSEWLICNFCLSFVINFFSHFNDKSQTKVSNVTFSLFAWVSGLLIVTAHSAIAVRCLTSLLSVCYLCGFLYCISSFFVYSVKIRHSYKMYTKDPFLDLVLVSSFTRVDLSELLICYLFVLLFFVLIQVSCKDYNSLEERYLSFYKEVVLLTARLAADWQCVGFCHG